MKRRLMLWCLGWWVSATSRGPGRLGKHTTDILQGKQIQFVDFSAFLRGFDWLIFTEIGFVYFSLFTFGTFSYNHNSVKLTLSNPWRLNLVIIVDTIDKVAMILKKCIHIRVDLKQMSAWVIRLFNTTGMLSWRIRYRLIVKNYNCACRVVNYNIGKNASFSIFHFCAS